MTKRKISSLLTTLGLATQLVRGQLEPDCNPLHAHCPAKKAWPHDNYYIDFTKETGPPEHWVIANHEVVNFTPKGAELTYRKKGDAPNMWTDFHVLSGRYDVEMQIAPGRGVISNLALWSDIQDEIDWDFSGNQHGIEPFPPPNGMWTIETNFFARGKMRDDATVYQKGSYKPTTQFHTYSVEWDEGHIAWYVDNVVVRHVHDVKSPSHHPLPQSPMKLQLGVWGGGDPQNNAITIEWAGGEIDMAGAPYTMYVRSVNITNKYPACQYKYKNKSGKISSIEKIQGDCPSASGASPKRARDYVATENPFKDTGTKAYPTAPASASTKYVVSSVSRSLPPILSPVGYAVTSQSTSKSASTTSLSSSSALTVASSSSSGSHPVASTHSAGSYPVASSSSAGSHPVASTPSSGSYPSASSSSESHPVASTPSAGSYPVASSSSTSSHPAASPSSGSYPSASSGSGSSPAASTHSAGSYPVASSSSAGSHPVVSTPSSGSYPLASSSSGGHPVASTPNAGSYPVSSTTSTGSHAAASLSSAGSYPVSSASGSHPAASMSSSGNYPSASSSSGSHPVASTSSTGTYSAASISTPGSYAASSASSTGGFLSSLSSFIMGTSSIISSGTIASSAQTVSNSTVTKSPAVSTSGIASVSSAFSSSSAGTLSTNASITGSATTRSDSGPETGSPSLYPTSSGLVPPISSSSVAPAGSSTPSGTPYSSSILPSSVKPGNSSLSSDASSFSSTRPPPTTSVQVMPSSYTFSSEITTSIVSTVYSTNIVTVTSCAPSVKNCPVGQITTQSISLYTTVCPVTNTIIDGETFSGQVSQVSSTAAAASSIPMYSHSSPSSSGPLLGGLPALPTTSLAPSVGTSSAIYMSSIIYSNTTTPSSPVQLPSTTTKLTTSTVYSTNIYTITSCAATVTNCPAQLGQVTTELVSLYTTVCPVKPEETGGVQGPSVPVNPSNPFVTSQPPATPSSSPISSTPVLTTSTVYTSSVYTITSCAPGAIDCFSSIGSVTTESVALYTTVCPVKDTPKSSTKPANPETSETVTKPTKPVTSGATSAVGNSALPSSSATTTASAPMYTTSTVYSTNVYTVTSCAPGMAGCSANLGAVTTEIIPVSTTVCPVTSKSIPAAVSSIPPANTGDYITTEITLSNTFSNSVVVITSKITFIDTPVLHSPTTAISTANTPGSPAGGSHPSTTQPCTTLTLGNHFTTVITYASITQKVPASVSPGPTATSYYTHSSAPNVDVPNYTMSKAPSTVGMGSSSTPAISKSLTAAVPGQKDGTGQCICEPTISTVFNTVTMTVAQTTVTSTKTVQPPFPSSYGTGLMPPGTGAPGRPPSSGTMPMSTGLPKRRWFRRGQAGHEHGHGHGHH